MMRLVVDVTRPLDEEHKIRVRLAMGTLASVRHIRLPRGDRQIEVYGEGLTEPMCRDALTEVGVVCETITTYIPVDEIEEAQAAGKAKEFVRPLGR